jgi:hypothetical protein
MPRIQFRLWHLILTIAAAASVVAAAVWLLRHRPPSLYPATLSYGPISVTLHFAGYEIPHTSPIFWVIVAVLLAAVLGLLVSVIGGVIWLTSRRVGRSGAASGN